MRAERAGLGFLALAVVTLASPAWCGGPPWHTYCEERVLLACPAGDVVFHVVALDGVDNRIANSTILIDAGACAAFGIAEPGSADPYRAVAPNVVAMETDAQGVAAFPLRAGGVCLQGLLVWADGITRRIDGSPIAPPVATSPDLDGNRVVDARDLSQLLGWIFAPGSDPAGDLNGDGRVGAGDLAILMRHLGHHD